MRRVPGLDTVPGEAIYRFTPADIAAARPDVVVLADEDGVRDTVRQLLPPGLRVVELSGSEQGTVAGQDGAFSVLSILSVLHSFPPMLVRAFQ